MNTSYQLWLNEDYKEESDAKNCNKTISHKGRSHHKNIQQRTQKHAHCKQLTCCEVNWSPPKALTQGFIPPVPRAITTNAIAGPILSQNNNGLPFILVTFNKIR